METVMYKTIVLDLLQDRPQMHEQLRQKRMLLQTVERYAEQLKKKHEGWKEVISKTRPGSDPNRIASEALELAMEDLSACLAPEYPPEESEALSLDDAMEFIRRPIPHA
jgi:hypothetical protein